LTESGAAYFDPFNTKVAIILYDIQKEILHIKLNAAHQDNASAARSKAKNLNIDMAVNF